MLVSFFALSHPVYNAHGVALRTNYREVNQLTSAVEISHEEVEITRNDAVIRSKDRRWGASFDTSTRLKYDGWGRVTTRMDAAATTVSYTYDLLSRTTDILEVTGTDDIYTRLEYDDESRVTKRAIKRNPTDSNWQETTYAYDERSRLITQCDAISASAELIGPERAALTAQGAALGLARHMPPGPEGAVRPAT